MKTKMLLPTFWKGIGIVLLLLSIVLSFSKQEPAFLNTKHHNAFMGNDNLADEVALTSALLGLLLIGFSKVKYEDEYTLSLRLSSLQWAVIVNYSILIVASWLVYGIDFMLVPVYNMFTILIIYIARFYTLLLFKNKGGNQ